MNNLKPGDKIKRIGSNNGFCEQGKIYTFDRYQGEDRLSNLYVKEYPGTGHASEYFILVNPRIKSNKAPKWL